MIISCLDVVCTYITSTTPVGSTEVNDFIANDKVVEVLNHLSVISRSLKKLGYQRPQILLAEQISHTYLGTSMGVRHVSTSGTRNRNLGAYHCSGEILKSANSVFCAEI